MHTNFKGGFCRLLDGGGVSCTEGASENEALRFDLSPRSNRLSVAGSDALLPVCAGEPLN